MPLRSIRVRACLVGSPSQGLRRSFRSAGLGGIPITPRDHNSTSAELVQRGRITICIRAWQAAMKVKGNSRPITSPLAKREWHCRGPGRMGMEPSFHALINFLH